MRAVRFHETGGPEVLRTETVDRPSPRANEVLVEVRAIGVNPTEVLSRTGARPHPLPRVPGSDFAGVVEAVGAEVETITEGTRVFGTGLQHDRHGTYAEFVPVRIDRLTTLDDEISFEEAAAVGVVGTTAWTAFTEFAPLTPTSNCLIHGGSGGVGHVAIQIAKRFGATVVTTAGSEESKAFTARCGADATFDYSMPDLDEAVVDATDGGVDVVLDHRVGDHLQLDIDVLAPDGTIVVIGGPDDVAEITALGPALRTDATIQVFAISNQPALGAILNEVQQLMLTDRLDVHVAHRFDLDEATEAQRTVIDESYLGKIVIIP